MNSFLEEDIKQPVEVQLAWEVMTCRALRTTYERKNHPCQWFNDHYGPYPAYDWIADFPKKSLAEGKKRVLKNVMCVGQRFQLPELMSGCRKAPIMTIGINPNLTAYWPGVDGATWCYPYFDDIGQYAHYFRYRSIYHERFSLEFIKANVVPGTEVVAKADGYISKMHRSKQTNAIFLTLDYEGHEDEELDLDGDYEIFFDSARAGQPNPTAFKKGDVIAARIDLKEGVETEIYQETVGYYNRFRSIFDRFKELVDDELASVNLCMAEDVCQADMVACASPGWGKFFEDEVLKGIERECVARRGWLVMQLLQTRPRVIVFSGKSAFDMFHNLLGDAIEPPVDLSLDTYELLLLCRNQGYYLKVADAGLSFDSRIVISPHFSYPDNFKPQCRFTMEEWQAFSQAYPQAAEKLKPVTRDNYIKSRKLVFIKDEEAPHQNEIDPAAWEELISRYYDTMNLIAEVLQQEYQAGQIVLDKKLGHFVRTPGPCRFCKNALFSFPEGCAYGKVDPHRLRVPTPEENVKQAARALLKNR